MNVTEKLIDTLLCFYHNNDNLDDIQECLKDYTGVVLAGSNYLREKHILYLNNIDVLDGAYPIFGLGRRADIYSAVLLNTLSAHVLELDDGHRYGMMHPGAPVFSALLALAQKERFSAEDILKAAAVGYEASIRLACMVQPIHKLKGFHASATCGAIGVATAVAFARHYNREELKNTLSAAATSASGLLEMINDDSELKPYNCAQAAVNGVLSANIGKLYHAPDDAISGKRGFIQTTNGTIDNDSIDRALIMGNCVGTTYKKMYASCRHTHSAVEAALKIRSRLQNNCDLKDIVSIRVETYKLAVYGHDTKNVQSISSAKMSTPYSVAVAIVYGLTSLDAFSPSLIWDEKVRKIEERVSVVESAELTQLSPGVRAAVVSVEMTDGTIITERIDYPKGEPENPLTDQESVDKMKILLKSANIEEKSIEQVLSIIPDIPYNWNKYYALLTLGHIE